jgi:hypothetical protein
MLVATMRRPAPQDVRGGCETPVQEREPGAVGQDPHRALGELLSVHGSVVGGVGAGEALAMHLE